MQNPLNISMLRGGVKIENSLRGSTQGVVSNNT